MQAPASNSALLLENFCVKNTFFDEKPDPDKADPRRTKSDSSLPTITAFEKEQEQEKKNQQNLAKFTELLQQISEPRISFEQFLAKKLEEDENFNLSQYKFLKDVEKFLPESWNNRKKIVNKTLEAHQNLQSIIQFQQELPKKICTVELMDPESKVISLLTKDGILELSEAHIEIAKQFFQKLWNDATPSTSSSSPTVQPLTPIRTLIPANTTT